MNSSNTLALLATILQATRSQLNQISGLNQASEDVHGHSLSPTFFTKLFGIQVTAALESIALAENDTREAKLRDLLFELTPAKVEWIEAVRQTEWHATSWGSDASQLLMQSTSLGITGTAAIAILSAHMSAQRFPIPKELNRHLHAAKNAVAKHHADFEAAERRRSEELRRQS